MTETKRQRLVNKLRELKNARAPWESTWKDIAEQVLPYRTVWTASEVNDGRRRDQKIYNNAPVLALRTQVSGMQTGITNQTRQWWGLSADDQGLDDDEEVNVYLEKVRKVMDGSLSRSDWYWVLGNGTYYDLGAFGTSGMYMEDWSDGLLFTGMAVGEYYYDADHHGRVDTCFREKSMTVRQIYQQFVKEESDLQNLSQAIRNAYDRGNYSMQFTLCHAVLPNQDYEPGKIGPVGKLWSSIWFDSNDNREDAVLRESGYESFPVLAPRWVVRPGDVYGRGPGWEARGDCRELQHYQKSGHRILDQGSRPPLKGHGVSRASMVPGDMTMLESSTSEVEPLYIPDPRWLAEIRSEKAEIVQRIDQTFYADLWRQLIDDQRSQRMTATEAEIQNRDRMNLLGPVLGNLDLTLFAPMVRRGLQLHQAAGRLPEAPEALRGARVKIVFMSILHQMQQATGLAGIRTLVDEAGRMSQTWPEVVDKIDTDIIIDEMGRITGVRPDITIPTAKADEVRAEKARIQEAQQTGDAMVSATEGAKNLSSVDPQQLQDLAKKLSPVAAAQGGAYGLGG